MKAKSKPNASTTASSIGGNTGNCNFNPVEVRKYNINIKGVIAIAIVDVFVTAVNIAAFFPDKYEKALKWLKSLRNNKNEEK